MLILHPVAVDLSLSVSFLYLTRDVDTGMSQRARISNFDMHGVGNSSIRNHYSELNMHKQSNGIILYFIITTRGMEGITHYPSYLNTFLKSS